MKKNGRFNLSAAVLMICLIFALGSGVCTEAGEKAPRPSANGRLHVSGTALADAEGRPAALRGLSTHGLTWFPDFVNESFFRQLSEDWDLSLVRLAMYSDIYCRSAELKEKSLSLLTKGIEAAIATDMYVIVDWHILKDNNPLMHVDEAADFFRAISSKYAGCPNILYEICNEPNSGTTWEDIRDYAMQIIPIIRENDPDSVILVGTPNFDRNLMAAALDPLPFEQVMYSLHFYAATHKDGLEAELKGALKLGLPVFITECGISEENGNGDIDVESAKRWFSVLKENNLSYAVWNISNKGESSAIFRLSYEPDEVITDRDLTDSGLWVRELIRGVDPPDMPPLRHEGDKSLPERLYDLISTAGRDGMGAARRWPVIALLSIAIAMLWWTMAFTRRIRPGRGKRPDSYDALIAEKPEGEAPHKMRDSIPVYQKSKLLRRILLSRKLLRAMIFISVVFTLLYLSWRILYSLPVKSGVLPVVFSAILLVVEVFGFLETLVHFENMLHLREHPLPVIEEDEYPEVDIFIATYNEPVSLLRKTVRGCTHLEYPDKSKVHIWICDDNRRREMRELAEELGVGYFDRPDNKGAKAGNLNHAMERTSAPYIVTLDADMIPRSTFLLKTIPYFVDVEKRCRDLPEDQRTFLGLLQTPQCFYNPDVFQHALYSERRAPNEQDFFYRSIEVAKTASNSVIYGGSNTVLSRKALEAAGGFYTESITEDFATGLLIESGGFLSLAIAEPLASGIAPYTYRDHIKQRTRWGRGVIVTARKLRIWRRKGLSVRQKINYWSSVAYWYSPVKNLVYMLSPILYSVFMIPIFRCSWLELLMYWMPMFLMQEFCLRLVSGNRVSTKWSGIYETSVMPHLLIPIVKEALGITLSSFKVTDKSPASGNRRKKDMGAMLPFLILIGLNALGCVRICMSIRGPWSLGLFILLFWSIRNLYLLLMAVFLTDGREEDGEVVHVYDAEMLVARREGSDRDAEGITTHMTEHSVSFFLDEEDALQIGDALSASIQAKRARAELSGVVISKRSPASGGRSVYTMEILDMKGTEAEYQQVLYDRIPTLPQNLNRDFDFFRHMWVNIANRLGRMKG